MFKIHKKTGSFVSLSFFGIHYADFDRTGHWAVWCLTKSIEAARILSMYNGFIGSSKLHQDSSMVVVRELFTFSPQIHQMKMSPNTHLLFDTELLHVGETSLSVITELKDGITKEKLGESQLKTVRFNFETRRPMRFPDWFNEKYASYKDLQEQRTFEKIALPKIPENAYKFRIVTNYSDMDVNQHSNQSSYIKFCMDAATHASLSGYYEHFKEDMCLYASLKWDISNVGESRANDELHIYTWQDDEKSPEHILFTILLNSKPIFHASTVFDRKAKPVTRQSPLQKL